MTRASERPEGSRVCVLPSSLSGEQQPDLLPLSWGTGQTKATESAGFSSLLYSSMPSGPGEVGGGSF